MTKPKRKRLDAAREHQIAAELLHQQSAAISLDGRHGDRDRRPLRLHQ